jgi:hypothetical protein
MKVGDLVKHFLTEQIGIVMDKSATHSGVQVLWTTQGLSLFGPGCKEWCSAQSLEALNESR